MPVIFIAAGLSIGSYLIFSPQFITSDGAQYLISAHTLSQNKGYQTFKTTFHKPESPLGPQYKWPPFYSFSIAAVMRITQQDEFISARIIHLLSIFIYLLSWLKITQRTLPDRLPALLAMSVTLVFPLGYWFYFTGYYSETLCLALLGVIIYLCVIHDKSTGTHKTLFILFISLLTGLMILTRNAAMGFAVGLTGYMLWRLVTKKDRLFSWHTLAFLLPMHLINGWWMLRNKILVQKTTVLDNLQDQGLTVWSTLYECLNKLIISCLGLPQRFEHFGFMVFLFMVILLALNFKSKTIEWQKDSIQILLWFLIAAYFCLIIVIRKKFGFSPMRYYYLLQPMFVIILLRMWSFKPASTNPRLPIAALNRGTVIILICLMGLSGANRTWSEIKIATALKDKPLWNESYLPMFMNSPDLINWLESPPEGNNLYISNFSKFVTIVLNGPCVQLSHEYDKNIANISSFSEYYDSVYAILSKKKGQWVHWPEWDMILENLNYSVIHEDKESILVKVQLPVQSEPPVNVNSELMQP